MIPDTNSHEAETSMFFQIVSDIREAERARDDPELKYLIAEIEGLALHAESDVIRARCADIVENSGLETEIDISLGCHPISMADAFQLIAHIFGAVPSTVRLLDSGDYEAEVLELTACASSPTAVLVSAALMAFFAPSTRPHIRRPATRQGRAKRSS